MRPERLRPGKAIAFPGRDRDPLRAGLRPARPPRLPAQLATYRAQRASAD